MKKLLLLAVIFLIIGSVFAFDATQNVSVFVLPGGIDVYSPVQDAIYDERGVLINLSMSANVSFFKYADNGGSLRTLCRKCDSYSKKKPFDDGFHQLTILGMFDNGTAYNHTNFTVDTKNPRITKTSPKKGFVNSFFDVWFIEENPENVTLKYGNNISGFKDKQFNIEECSLKKGKYHCTNEVDLIDYDLEEIVYWFVVSDILNNTDESKKIKLDVDVSAPVINLFNYSINGRYATFFFNITEKNFEEINYIDWNATNPKWRTLCSSLKNNICEKRKSFRIGLHNVSMEILDKAGNSAVQNAEFEII